MLTPGHFGGGHGHDGAGNMAITPTGHIAASGIDRDRLLSDRHPRHDLIFDIRHGGFLLFRKAAHIVMAELDIGLRFLGDQRTGGLDLFRRQEHIAVVFVELGRVFQRFGIATGFDVIEDIAHDPLGLGRIRARG